MRINRDYDYHQPSDEIRPDWNFDGMVEDAQIGFFAALEIANADQAPAGFRATNSTSHAKRRSQASVRAGS
jgi:hypothetical protein